MVEIALVGEAYGEHEERQRVPFVGPSGYELTRMLDEAGIRRADCFLTNVFNLRPAGNDIETLCGNKAGDTTGLPPIRTGKYIRAEYLGELERLNEELRREAPNIIIALGGTASWALLHDGRISKIRGTVSECVTLPGIKVLPTYHPAAILRQWDNRHVTILDLMKGKRESEFKEIRRPEREIWIEPSIEDLETFYERHLVTSSLISFDIETVGDQITCVGFSGDHRTALVIPFFCPGRTPPSYWSSPDLERQAWGFVRRVLESETPKLAQNGLYDVHFLWRRYGIPVRNFSEDTMLLHHALQPESLKGLGFLGSVYTNEASWKLMRNKTIKKEA